MTTQPPTTEPPSNGPADSWIRDRAPDRSLFFRNPEHDRLLELVRHLVENTDHIVLLCGEEGAGKSTFLYRLQGELPDHWLFCRLDANPLMHADQLLNNLAKRLHAAPGGEQTPERISAALSALQLQGRLPLVLLDDADQLPASSLMALLRLHEQHEGDRPDFALLLLAHPRIEDTLDSHQLHAMGTAHFNKLVLSPLPLELTADYVRHYLRVENAPDDINLSPEQLARVHRRGHGLPGRINEQVIRVLHEPHQRSMRLQLPQNWTLPGWLSGLPPITLAAAAAVLLLLVATLALQERINALFQPPPDTIGLALPTPTMSRSLPLTHETATPATEPVQIAQEEQAPQPLEQEGPEPGGDSKVEPPEEPYIDEPLIPPPPETLATPPAAALEPAPHPAGQPAAALAATAPTERAAKPTTNNMTIPLPDETWLLRQPPGNYSLQLLAAGNEAAVKRYLNQARLPDKLVYFESTHNHKPWFTVLYGSYPSRDTALEALKRLPAKLRKSGAWPRRLDSVQAAIRDR